MWRMFVKFKMMNVRNKKPVAIGSFEEAMVWHQSYRDVCLSRRY